MKRFYKLVISGLLIKSVISGLLIFGCLMMLEYEQNIITRVALLVSLTLAIVSVSFISDEKF